MSKVVFDIFLLIIIINIKNETSFINRILLTSVWLKNDV